MVRKSGRHRPQWFVRFRAKGAPAYIEQTEDRRWRIIVGRTEIAIVASSTIAVELVDQLDAVHRKE